MSGWQDISTAPKDHLILISGDAGDGTYYVASGGWCEAGNGIGPFWTDYTVQHWGMEEYMELHPTYWMPLPDAPVALSAIDEGRGGCDG